MSGIANIFPPSPYPAPMLIRTLVLTCLTLAACAPHGRSTSGERPLPSASEPLSIGEWFTLDSRILGETRRINVFIPTIYGQSIDAALPVLYMPDGGLNEDFLHMAGLVQVLVCNGGMRPFMLIGIQNTQRRRDLTGPSSYPEDQKIAPVIGGSAAFRRFIREELMPTVRDRYRITDETAIIGESLAGLFAVESFILEPDLFNTCIALDPSLQWRRHELTDSAPARLSAAAPTKRTIYLGSSSEPLTSGLISHLADTLKSRGDKGITAYFEHFQSETHATIYHPAAIAALRTVFPAPPN